MKIQFCDLCNESVPLSDIDAGRARTVKGRVICAACDAAMSHPAPAAQVAAQSRPGAGTAAPAATLTAAHAAAIHAGPTATTAPAAASTKVAGVAWAAGLAIAFTALSIFVTDDRLAAVGQKQGQLEAELARKDDALRSLQGALEGVHPALAEVEKRQARRVDDQAASAAALAENVRLLREDQSRIQARLDALALEIERVRARVDEPGAGIALEKRFDELSARIARAEDERRTLAAKVVELGSAPPAAARPAEAKAAPGAPAWTKHVPDLESAEETLRWEAVTALADSNDPAVVPHIVPRLGDASVFVRMAAARVLGEMRARAAVPNLIDALEDGDSAVRETAWIALRQISGKDLKFDPYGNEADRQKRVKAWREWWKKEGEGEKPAAGS